MAVPDFQTFFKPLLVIASDGLEHSIKEARESIASDFNLTDEEINERVPSGSQTKFDNRISWAKSYFLQAKILESTRRAHFRITERGKELLTQNHQKISIKILERYPEFVEFHTASKQEKTPKHSSDKDNNIETPEEVFQKAFHKIQSDLASEILTLIKSNSPAFFENLVIDLMVAMGYGGSRTDAGQSLGKSGDEGIDGIIKEDRLGLDVIYLQAKKWEGTVGPEPSCRDTEASWTGLMDTCWLHRFFTTC